MRNIIRLDIKQDFIVKGRQFEGYRKVVPIQTILEKIKDEQCEIFLYDVVATLFGLNSIIKQLSVLLSDIFLPITVGGGIDSISKVDASFRLGADRIAINSANFKDVRILSYIAEKYGKQSAVAHIEAKKIDGNWCAMYQNGREIGSNDIDKHVKNLQAAGAGELIISSVDNDGMLDGFPLELASTIDKVANVPVVLSGGIAGQDASKLFHELKSINGLCISRAFLEKTC